LAMRRSVLVIARKMFRGNPGRTGPVTALAVVATLGVGVLLSAAGCQEQIFTPDEARSQFDRFDAVRDRRAPSYIEDEFGRKRPNMRARLLTSE